MFFEPSRQAAFARLASVDPAAYARTRNALDGAVTRLSPYLTHGLLSLREVYAAVNARHPLDAQHKLVFELGWRAYWRHVWAHLGDGIHQSLHPGLMPDANYASEMPVDVLEARTDIPVIDLAVKELYETGYLHNHARMWLASYLVHVRKVHWHTGAQWMLGHLLDGDLASNHLSWQWVAGTGSSKPYLFNADNVTKYAPANWHSPGTIIDTSYEALDRLARTVTAVRNPLATRRTGEGVQTPALHRTPQGQVWKEPDHALAEGQDVWLIHPWSLGSGPVENSAGVMTIGVGIAECHASMPWSALRWNFVTDGIRASTALLWWGSSAQIAHALRGAKSVRWIADPHIDVVLSAAVPGGQPFDRPCLFQPVEKHCSSFSAWWRRTTICA